MQLLKFIYEGIGEILIGERGFEPLASWSRTMRATKLRYSPPRENFLWIRVFVENDFFHFSLNSSPGQRLVQYFGTHPSPEPPIGSPPPCGFLGQLLVNLYQKLLLT